MVANRFPTRYRPTMRKLLFLCTANYYRSRFAEMLFNHLAAQHQLNWVADSRGIATNLGTDNTDVISEHTVNGLLSRGVDIADNHRSPIQGQTQDFEQADLVIALDEQEHRPYMERCFPDWADRIEYWQVGDLHITTAEEALSMADVEVRSLVQRLVEWACISSGIKPTKCPSPHAGSRTLPCLNPKRDNAAYIPRTIAGDV